MRRIVLIAVIALAATPALAQQQPDLRRAYADRMATIMALRARLVSIYGEKYTLCQPQPPATPNEQACAAAHTIASALSDIDQQIARLNANAR